MSKFEDELLNRLNDEVDNKKVSQRAYRRATGRVEAQIAQLNVKKTELEDELEDATDAINDTMYSENFQVSDYDKAQAEVDRITEEIEDVNTTFENRQKLLTSWK